MSNASKGKEVKQNVSSTISSATQELIATEMEPLGDTGFDFLEYDHLEIYQGIRLFLCWKDKFISPKNDEFVFIGFRSSETDPTRQE